MLPRETFDTTLTALHRFRTHPVQTALTLAGLVVGTAAIILIVALGLTGQSFVLSQIEGVGSNMIYAYHQGGNSVTGSKSISDDLSLQDLQAVRERVPNLSAAAAIIL